MCTNFPCASTCFPIPISRRITHQSNYRTAPTNHNHQQTQATDQRAPFSFDFFSQEINMLGTSTSTPTLLFTVFLSFCISIIMYCTVDSTTNWSAFYASGVLVAGLLLTSTLVVVAARATMLAWITVLVLLAFAGKRRKVLVQQGRKITTDVVMYLFQG
ncbi:conserved hypothetical protein [Ricinus communis]|uniref:Uncharacterized protein n=1 Tax=Ricinus communis TaxID=3988 RepID=B9RAU6_RICCO|nr:conserved hypothetical protein [Ricinus communis]